MENDKLQKMSFEMQQQNMHQFFKCSQKRQCIHRHVHRHKNTTRKKRLNKTNKTKHNYWKRKEKRKTNICSFQGENNKNKKQKITPIYSDFHFNYKFDSRFWKIQCNTLIFEKR